MAVLTWPSAQVVDQALRILPGPQLLRSFLGPWPPLWELCYGASWQRTAAALEGADSDLRLNRCL